MRKKITIIGAGFVGSTLAQRVMERKYADVVMLDIVPNMPQGKALDIQQAGAILGYDSKIIGTNNYVDTKNSDIVVITSGIARKPGMTREDLLRTNQKIVTEVTKQVIKYSPSCIIIVVTNPLNVMTQLVFSLTKFPREKVIGMAGVLDAGRFKTLVAQKLNVSTGDIEAHVLGDHGELMISAISLCTVGGVHLTKLLSAKEIEQIVNRTRDGGAEIVKLLGTGSAYIAPSAAVLQMIDAIIFDSKTILPCAVMLKGEYDIKNVFVGVPVKLGAKGVEEIIKLPLNKKEHELLKKSANTVKELVGLMEKS